MTTRDQYIATLVLAATSDMFAKGFEGWKKQQISKYLGFVDKPLAPKRVFTIVKRKNKGNTERDEFGPLKFHSLKLELGDVTDDSILEEPISGSIIANEGRVIIPDIAQRHLEPFAIRRKPDGTYLGGFGRTTTVAVENMRGGIPYTEAATNWGPGTGPCMRIQGLSLWMDASGQYEQGLQYAYEIGRITHLDPRSLAAGVVQAHAVFALLKGVNRFSLIHGSLDVCNRFERPLTLECLHQDKGSLAEKIQWVLENRDADDETAHDVLKSNSLVFRAYPFTLFMAQKYLWTDPVAGFLKLVNFGGDCDTTGAMYGALCGAMHGMVYPRRWTNKLKTRKEITARANALYDLRETLLKK